MVPNSTGCTSDNAPCTDDVCSGQSPACTHVANSAPCDDGSFCNGVDTCSGGSCSVHAGNPCPGPDGDAACAESCSEAADSCTAQDPNGSPCSDNDACTTGDNCQSGLCTGEPEPSCNTTTTTLEGPMCGDANGDARITVTDALMALRTAIGDGNCPLSICDYNGDGKLLSSDALAILRVSVGQAIPPACGAAAGNELPTSGSVTTTT